MESNEVAEATSSNKGELQQDVFALDSAGSQSSSSKTTQPHTLYNLTTYTPQTQTHYLNPLLQYPPAEKMGPQSRGTSGNIQMSQSPKPSGTFAATGQASSSVEQPCAAGTSSYNADQRPGYTYEELAIMALDLLPSNKGTIAEIYEVIQHYFPYFKNRPSKTWKGSLRHSVSRSPYMRRIINEQEKPNLLAGGDALSLHGQPSDGSILTSTPDAPQKKGPRQPIMWELYEPAEDDVRGRKKPRRGSLPPLPSDFALESTHSKQRPRKMTLGHLTPSQQMPNVFAQLNNPAKLDHNANFAAPQYPQQILYGAQVTPEMYPFVTSLLDLSRNRPNTSGHVPPDCSQSAAKKPKLSPASKIPASAMPPILSSQYAHIFPRPAISEEAKRSSFTPTVSASGHDYAKVPPSYPSASKTATFINQDLPKHAPVANNVPSTSSSGTNPACCPVDHFGGHSMLPPKSLQQQTSYHAWPANAMQGVQSLTAPNQQLQHNLPQAAPTTTFTPFQRENTGRPISWKVQNGYLVQTARGPSPPPLINPSQMPGSSVSLLPSGTNLNLAAENEAHHQIFQPWQLTQPVQYPYMQYQIPPQAQRYPLFNTSPSQSSAPSSPPRQHQTFQNIRTCTYSYPSTDVPQVNRSFGSQESRSFGSTSSTPSLVDSGIIRDSGLDSVSPVGSEDTLPARPGSEGMVADEVVWIGWWRITLKFVLPSVWCYFRVLTDCSEDLFKWQVESVLCSLSSAGP